MAEERTPAVPQARGSDDVDSQPRRLGYSSLAAEKAQLPAPPQLEIPQQTQGLGEHRPPRADKT
jgi:hypothetical protein